VTHTVASNTNEVETRVYRKMVVRVLPIVMRGISVFPWRMILAKLGAKPWLETGAGVAVHFLMRWADRETGGMVRSAPSPALASATH